MIALLFNTLFFLIPLIFFKNTSELFEFSKVITLYSITCLIVSVWSIESIKQGKFIFRRTILDIPLLVYLTTLLVSTVLSIDPRISWLGYYSRFNGGLITQICYALLYWAFVSNMTAKQSLTALYYSLASTTIASLLAILEHFGIFSTCASIIRSILNNPINSVELDKYNLLPLSEKIKYLFTKKCFEQDIQSRVFSTFGQPNWLAATIVAISPVAWIKINEEKLKIGFKKIFLYIIPLILFTALVFTKSRSGLLAFGIELILFGFLYIYKNGLANFKKFIILIVSFATIFLLSNPFKNYKITTTTPALETGGTESGTIRKYVWLGAFEVFKNYPVFGTGPETFAFSYTMFKDVSSNLTSEWNFIYNKAHNEYLNTMANTGIFGILAYSALIVLSIIQIYKSKNLYILAGYISILITNFFGFTVVPTALLFFLFPAIAFTQNKNVQSILPKFKKLDLSRKLLISIIVLSSTFILYTIYQYYKADIYYNKAKNFNRSNNPAAAEEEIRKALVFSPSEPLFISELAIADGKAETAINALKLSPFNQNIRRILVSNLIKSSGENPDNLLIAERILEDGISISPNDPQLYYQLGILQIKLGRDDDAVESLERSIKLKTNYKEARFALGLIYIDIKNYEAAKQNFEYILTYIDPKDELTKKYLDQANSSLK